MSLNSAVVGQTFGLFQVSDGAAVAGNDSYSYTEGDFEIGPVTVDAYNALDNSISLTVTYNGNLYETISGTVIGNSSDAFLVSAVAVFADGAAVHEAIYLANTPGGQHGFSTTTNVPAESANIAYSPACYCCGTRIATPEGWALVEELAVGDMVVTASGQHRAVAWLGRRSYAGRFLAANPGIQPICFRAGSLGAGLPRRDLLVSPEHAMFLGGVLVPARLLVNGTTIVQRRGCGQVDYFHVELDSHDVLLAEGAPSESFVDDDSRGMFQNAAEWEQMHPGRTRASAVFCAPRVECGPELEAIRRRLDSPAASAALAA